MTEESQKRAIVEALGKCVFAGNGILETREGTTSEFCLKCGQPFGYHETPDYLHDLNAMHEAEKSVIIGTEYEDAYYCRLVDDFGNGSGCTWHSGVSATAAQRAEAFLRTIDKWTEP